MKRFFFSAIALMVAATACTESGIIDTPDFYGKSIVFDTYIGKNPLTKAENVDITYLKIGEDAGVNIVAYTCPKDNVIPDNVDYSFNYLDGTLDWSGEAAGSGNWVYLNSTGLPEEAYMPTGKDLAFAAYNIKADECINSATQTNTQFEFLIKNEVESQVDLLVAPFTFVSETGDETQVPLRFYHLLSRVGFQIQSTGGNAAIQIKSLKLCGKFPKAGLVDMTLATATPDADNGVSLKNGRPEILPIEYGEDPYVTEYELIAGDEPFEINSNECTSPQRIYSPTASEGNGYMMIMPTVQTEASVVVSYRIGETGEFSVTTIDLKELNRLTFDAGKAYEFILKIASESIKFSAEVVEGDWDKTPEATPLN